MTIEPRAVAHESQLNGSQVLHFVDDRGEPGMIGVLMPGVHTITAPWHMSLRVIEGTLHCGDKMIDVHSGPLRFNRGEEMSLRVVKTDDGGLNHRHPVVFIAHQESNSV